ncbi:Tetratricopeptide repeat protein [compost metagenome]
MALAAAKQQDEALQVLRKAIEEAPQDPDAHYQLGRVLLKLGKDEEARTHLEAFERLRPK